jgi:hypothetical protein
MVLPVTRVDDAETIAAVGVAGTPIKPTKPARAALTARFLFSTDSPFRRRLDRLQRGTFFNSTGTIIIDS